MKGATTIIRLDTTSLSDKHGPVQSTVAPRTNRACATDLRRKRFVYMPRDLFELLLKWTNCTNCFVAHMPFDDDEVMVKMSFRFRRAVQTLTVAVLIAYTTLLVYQTLSRAPIEEEGADDAGAKLAGNYLVEARDPFDPRDGLVSNEITSEISSATATMRPPATVLDDVFISVKTTKLYHRQRLPIILKTWFQLAKKQTWFFTDTDDEEFQRQTNGHMINTNCSSSHYRKALCCKMAVEFDTFLESNRKWFCHFDDDNYVNVPRLVRFLGDYNPRKDWYLGKPSIQAPLEINSKDKGSKVKFWFATGGAGFCLSRSLALKMVPVASGGKFMSTGEKIRLPDDVTMGYIIEHLLKKSLTVVDQFHSHLEPMKFIRREILEDQISFSYAKTKDEWNVVKIEGFDRKYDQNRFLSLHCYLFPNFSYCPRKR
ncbi:fringe glycosyltransferase isoform X2 [Onthophagus taurus]|uniref:fringe glycosyltransferase isoform X2 n=1 Tax=Onthophagus taurus TaxID=166361 RepID=UPI000C2000C5|nr:fringe glycosyltransferase isoform X2 [Onthophagus taurus]